jgi:allantoin racemase
MKVWHQSLIPENEASKPYYDALRAHAAACASDGTTVVLHGYPEELYPGALTPAVVARSQLGERFQANVTVRRVLQAEREGYDAFIIATLQDPGLQEARTAVDIPVVGYGQAAALIGRCYGDRLGVLGFNGPLLTLFRERLDAHVPGVTGPLLDLDVGYDSVMDAFGKSDWRPRLEEGCRSLIAQGANVIVPGQMLMAEVMWTMGLHRVGDVPIIDGLGVLIGLAELLVRLQSTSGMTITRNGFSWARPDTDVIHLFESSIHLEGGANGLGLRG